MTRILDEKSSGLIAALTGKSQEFASEVSRVTDHAVKAIEAKGFIFTQTMMDNSEQIARLINEASADRHRSSVTRSLRAIAGRHSASVTLDQDAKTHGSPAPRPRTSCISDDQGGDRAVEADRLRHRRRDAGNARHAALRHHCAVRAPARGQHPAAGGAQRRPREHERDREHAGRRALPNSSPP